MNSRFLLSLLFTLHAGLILLGAFSYAWGRTPQGIARYLGLFQSNQHWGIFGGVFRFRRTQFQILSRGHKYELGFGNRFVWQGEGLPREDYLYRLHFIFRRGTPESRDYVSRWCRYRGLPPTEKIVLSVEVEHVPATFRTAGPIETRAAVLPCDPKVPAA